MRRWTDVNLLRTQYARTFITSAVVLKWRLELERYTFTSACNFKISIISISPKHRLYSTAFQKLQENVEVNWELFLVSGCQADPLRLSLAQFKLLFLGERRKMKFCLYIAFNCVYKKKHHKKFTRLVPSQYLLCQVEFHRSVLFEVLRLIESCSNKSYPFSSRSITSRGLVLSIS